MIIVENRMSNEEFFFSKDEEREALAFAEALAHKGEGRYAKEWVPVQVRLDGEVIWEWTAFHATGYEQ